MGGGRTLLVVLLVVSAASIPLLVVPPLGAYLMAGAVLFWRWVGPRSPEGPLRVATRIGVLAMFGVQLAGLVLAVGICGLGILVFECPA